VTTRHLCRIVAYVSHHRVIDYMRCGWMVISDLGGLRATHGEFSALMGWPCPCKEAMPTRSSTTEPAET
jgi:hypothetical protein